MQSAKILVVGFVAFVPDIARADWDYARWGMTPEAVAAASGGTTHVLPPASRVRHPSPWNSETAAEGVFTDGALHLKLSFSFGLKGDGLSCVVFTAADLSQNDLFKAFLVKRQGQPSSTGGAPEYGMTTYRWDGAADDVGLTLMKDGSSFATQCRSGVNPPVE